VILSDAKALADAVILRVAQDDMSRHAGFVRASLSESGEQMRLSGASSGAVEVMIWKAVFRGRHSPPSGAIVPLLVAAILALSPLSRQASGQMRQAPSVTYAGGFGPFYEGEFKDALRLFEDEWRGAIKTPQSRWIDSICYHTMIGECYYHMGQLDDALRHYNDALALYLAFSDWMMWVENFPPAIRPAQDPAFRPCPWGASNRAARPGHFPTPVLMRQGRIDQNAVFRQGGVVQQAQLFPVDAQEIVRCTTLAIRRRTELLGPLAQHDRMTTDLVAALSGPVGRPNHWSQACIDVQLGLAYLAAGKQTQAIPVLNRSIVAAGQYDHPLTSTALLELGKLALSQGDFDQAAVHFYEASVAAYRFFDGGILEEALSYGALAHLAANNQGVYPPLEPAANWAKLKDLRRLRVSLLLSAAENLAVLGQTAEAAAMLDQAAVTIGRRPMALGRAGARLNYLRATVFFQQRNAAAGDEALAAAMGYMQRGSHWVHHIVELDRLFTAGQVNTRSAITPRTAMELYAELLRDPEATDWTLEPMESLAVLRTPHPQSFEHWFLVALARKDHEAALEIADRARRHRFLSTLAYGGRLQSLRWILEGPDEVLDQQARLNRQDLLAQYPAYGELSRQVRQLRAAGNGVPLAPEDPKRFRQLQDHLAALGTTSAQQEAILREIAVRREPAGLVFPPMRSIKEVQEALPEGNVVLAFFAVGSELYGFLLNRDQYEPWKVKGGPVLVRQIAGLLRAMGHFAENRELSLNDLESSQWKQAAEELLSTILEGSRADFTADFPELVVVPDGVMWYVPFESLLVDVAGEVRPLISRFRIRYAPTVSLAIPDGRAPRPTADTAVVVGRLFPRDEDEVAQAAYEDLAKVVPRCVSLSKPPLPGPSSLYASLMDRLIVLDDLDMDDHGPYSWAPIPLDGDKPGNSLGDWLGLPWQAPRVVILPGYHTAAENSLKRVGTAAPGAEVFLSVCGLLSSGARTLLLSRWRSGGQTSFDVVREFAQELPHTTPAKAYQRAVLVVGESRLDLEAEPRIQRAATVDPPKATHPFFWAGYMLVDSGVRPERVEAEGEGEPEQAAVKLKAPEQRKLQPAPPP
jgi:hypothetical protein